MIFGRKKKKIESNLDDFLKKGESFSETDRQSEKAKDSSLQSAFPSVTAQDSAPKSTPEPARKIISEGLKPVESSPKKSFSFAKLNKAHSKDLFAPKNNFRNPEILQLDLIKQEAEGRIDWRRYINLMIAALFMAALLVAQVYFIISWWEENTSTSENITKNIEKAQKEIKNLQKNSDEAMSFRQRAELVTPLLDRHISWTNFFRYLERNTLSNVTFDSFTGDTKGTYVLQGEAKHFSDINWQVKKFLADEYTISASVAKGTSEDLNSKFGEMATSSGAIVTDEGDLTEEQKLKAVGPKTVSFSITLKVKPEVFLNK